MKIIRNIAENVNFLLAKSTHFCYYTYVMDFFIRSNEYKGGGIMAKCAICQKAAHFGNGVSHSHRRSNKIWNANVKSVKVKVNGGTRKMYVCTSCLRSGLVERA